MKLIETKEYLLLIDEEAEIKERDWYYHTEYNYIVQCKAEPNINMFDAGYRKILAYYPLTKEAKELDLPLLPPFEEVDIEKLAKLNFPNSPFGESIENIRERNGFIEGYKAAQSKGQYSLEDIKKAIEMARRGICSNIGEFDLNALYGLDDLQEVNHKYSDTEIIQSLSTQQLPKEVIVETYGCDGGCGICDNSCNMLKIITNSKGKEELVGTYKY